MLEGFLTSAYLQIYKSHLNKGVKNILLQLLLTWKTLIRPEGSTFPDPLEMYRLDKEKNSKRNH